MNKPIRELVAILLILVSSASSGPAIAGEAAFVEAGPQDGILCCNGNQRFYFDGSRVLVTTGRAGIFRSDDQGALGAQHDRPGRSGRCRAAGRCGKTWQRRAALPTNLVSWMEVDPGDPLTLYISANDRAVSVWKSTDGGRSVRRLALGLALLAVRPGTVYFARAVPPQLLRSTDGGATLTPLPLPPTFDRRPALTVSPDGATLFVTSHDGQGHRASFRSRDGGATYAAVQGGLVFEGTSAFDPSDPNRVYAKNDMDKRMTVSTDGGLNFSPLPAARDPRFLGDPHEISVDGSGALFVNSTGGLFRSDDHGLSFHPVVNGFQASSVADLAFDPIGNAPGIHVDGVHNDPWSVAASPSDANTVILALYGDGLVRTDNGGSSWSAVTVTGATIHDAIYSRMAFATPSRVYLVCTSAPESGLYRSDDAGRSFTLLDPRSAGTLAVDPTNPDVFYIGDFDGSTGLFKSIDGGVTLQDLGRPGTYAALAVDRRDPRVVYAGERYGQLVRSLDGGQTFSVASQGGHRGVAASLRGRGGSRHDGRRPGHPGRPLPRA